MHLKWKLTAFFIFNELDVFWSVPVGVCIGANGSTLHYIRVLIFYDILFLRVFPVKSILKNPTACCALLVCFTLTFSFQDTFGPSCVCLFVCLFVLFGMSLVNLGVSLFLCTCLYFSRRMEPKRKRRKGDRGRKRLNRNCHGALSGTCALPLPSHVGLPRSKDGDV